MNPTLVLVAHGTRRSEGLQTISDLAAALSEHVGPVLTSFVDVLGPNPRELLAGVDGPAIVVPAFLASGYHVNTDLPARVRESGHRQAVITPALGPDPAIAEVMFARLLEAGWLPGDAVVMAAAGSSDPEAHRDLGIAAALLAELVGEVHLGFVATGTPKVTDVVDRLKARGGRVFVASYLLAPGVFHSRLLDCGAYAATAPLADHPKLVGLLADRFADVVSSMPLNGEYEPSTSDWARENAELYMASGGTAGTELKGKPVVLLTTVGAKTGKLRKTPLMRVEHDGHYAVVASLGGAPKHPVWYHNIVKHPLVELQDGTSAGEYEAREVSGAEKAAWWARAVEVWPDYADYQQKTDREIPVFVLTPIQ